MFVDKLLSFPLWVKQIIYLRLHQNLSLSLSEDFITVNEHDIFHLYVPTLSFIGKTELIEKKSATIGANNVNNKNLKKILVKDLKTLATELNIDLYKVVDTVDTVSGKTTSKKTALLKDELVEKISSLINRSI